MPSEPSPPVAKPKRPRSEKQRANDLRLKELWQARHAAKRAAPEAPKAASPAVAVPRSAGDPPKATERAPEAKPVEKPKSKSFFQSIGFS
jgi:hypothetical protein